MKKMNVCSKEIEPTKKTNKREREKKRKKENSRTKIKVSKKVHRLGSIKE